MTYFWCPTSCIWYLNVKVMKHKLTNDMYCISFWSWKSLVISVHTFKYLGFLMFVVYSFSFVRRPLLNSHRRSDHLWHRTSVLRPWNSHLSVWLACTGLFKASGNIVSLVYWLLSQWRIVCYYSILFSSNIFPSTFIIISGLQIHICNTLMRRLNKKRGVHAFYLTK